MQLMLLEKQNKKRLLMARQEHKAIVEMLFETDMVRIDSNDKDGRTPLSWAVEKGHEAVTKLLLKKGAKETQSFDPAIMLS